MLLSNPCIPLNLRFLRFINAHQEAILKQVYHDYPSMEASEDPATDISVTLGEVYVPK
jgi:hypothetical protein